MRRIRNPVYGYAVTWVRIPPSPPSTCPIRDRDSIVIANRAPWRDFAFWGPNWFAGRPLPDSGQKSPAETSRSLEFVFSNPYVGGCRFESPPNAGRLDELGLLVAGAVRVRAVAVQQWSNSPTVVQRSLAAYPASGDSSFITGCDVVVGGGRAQD